MFSVIVNMFMSILMVSHGLHPTNHAFLPALSQQLPRAVGTYMYPGYTGQVIFNLSQEGKQVEGTITGDCKGSVKGQWNNSVDGKLTANGFLSCYSSLAVLNGSIIFTGQLSSQTKTGYVNFTASSGNQEVHGVIPLKIVQ